MPRALTPEERKAKALKRQASGEKTGRTRAYTIRYGVVGTEALSEWAIVWTNPGYSRPPAPRPNGGQHGAKRISPPLDFSYKKEFYYGLLDSVSRSGVRNPVFAVAYEDGTYVRYGCSRTWAARRAGKDLPVIIADYAGVWDGLEELKDEQAIRAKYVDQPAVVELKQDSMRIDGCPQ